MRPVQGFPGVGDPVMCLRIASNLHKETGCGKDGTILEFWRTQRCGRWPRLASARVGGKRARRRGIRHVREPRRGRRGLPNGAFGRASREPRRRERGILLCSFRGVFGSRETYPWSGIAGAIVPVCVYRCGARVRPESFHAEIARRPTALASRSFWSAHR